MLFCFYEYLMYYYKPINHMYYEPWKFTFEEIKHSDIKHVYAIDFDNTIAYTQYPKIIKPLKYAVEVLQYLSKDPKSILILWTCREKEDLQDALNWLEVHDIHFDYVNENCKELMELYGNDTRKIGADVYIDDKSYQGIEGVEKLWKDWYEYIKENCNR